MCEVLRVGEECHLRPHYTLNPDLPPGLSLDPHTGCITGTPEAHALGTKSYICLVRVAKCHRHTHIQ